MASPSEHVPCAKHGAEHWWRHTADSPRTPAGQPGIWTCGVCYSLVMKVKGDPYEPDLPLIRPIERFDITVHEVPGSRRSIAPDLPRHVVGKTKPDTLTLEKAQALFEQWRGEEYGWVKARVITLARIYGEFHGEMMVGITLEQPNLIGAAVNSLARQGVLEKLNRNGEVEHRQTKSGTSRRASYVWRLSAKGRALATQLRKELGNTDRLPGPRREDAIDGDVSRDGMTIQGVLGA